MLKPFKQEYFKSLSEVIINFDEKLTPPEIKKTPKTTINDTISLVQNLLTTNLK